MKSRTLWWMMKWHYKWLVRSEPSCSALLLPSVRSKRSSQALVTQPGAWRRGRPAQHSSHPCSSSLLPRRQDSPVPTACCGHPWLTAISRMMLENSLWEGWLGWVQLLHPHWSKGLQGWWMAIREGVFGTQVGFWILRQVVQPSVQDICGFKRFFLKIQL